MDEQVSYQELYREMIEEMEIMHKDNLHRIKIGFRSILIVPTIFMLMLFFTASSKTVFLILWIVSMFIIAIYLVIVEYSDYKLQARINKATDKEGTQATSMIRETIESNKNAMHELLMREESKLPFKFSSEEETDDDLDAAEYEIDYDSDNEELEDVESGLEVDELDSGGLSADDYDTISGESGDVLSLDSDEVLEESYGADTGEGVIPIVDMDDDIDDVSTLLDDTPAAAIPPSETVSPAESESSGTESSVVDDSSEVSVEQDKDEPDSDVVPDDIDFSALSEDTDEDGKSAAPENAGDKITFDNDDDGSSINTDDAETDIDGMSLDDILSEYHSDYFASDGDTLDDGADLAGFEDDELSVQEGKPAGTDVSSDEFEDSSL